MKIEQPGTYSMTIDCPTTCTLSVSENSSKNSYTFNFPIKETFSLNANSPGSGPNVQVLEVIPPSTDSKGEQNLRIVIQNIGDVTASLQNASLNVPSKILYMPKFLSAGNASEIIVQTSTSDNLKLNLNYKSANVGCPPIDVLALFDLSIRPPCKTNSDCSNESICCAKQCRDPNTGICRDVNGDGIPDWIPYSK
jgi:hypothetical protein